LVIFPTNSIIEPVVPPISPVPTNMTLASPGRLNWRYSPWGGNPEIDSDPLSPSDPAAYDRSVKDPGLWQSDQWDLPVGEPLSLFWLGRVHRGTPWQTVYLKSEVASAEVWCLQSPDPRTHPTNDWALAAVLASLLNTNPPQLLASVNDPSPANWAKVWDGLIVLSNDLSDEDLLTNSVAYPSPDFASFTMSSNSPQAATLTEAVSVARSARTNRRFTGLADFLRVPELTVASPWLNVGDPFQYMFGMSDAAYEAIPAQILSRLREEDLECSLVRREASWVMELSVPWPGQSCVLETSANLLDWVSASGSLFPTNGMARFDPPPATNTAPLYYRAKLLP
jgi:hypothetical protein